MSTGEAMQQQDSNWQMLRCWQGLGLRNWIRLLAMRPDLDLTSLPQVASLTCRAAANSLLSSLESLLYRRAVARTPLHESPIFILGHWRSGTTLLHNLLALDRQFAFPNLYQVLHPGHFLLTESRQASRTARHLPRTRPMDNMACDWQLPEEDETALLLMTLYSPYLSVVFPKNRQKSHRFANLRSGLSDREMRIWQSAFLHFLRKVSFKSGSRRLILKSPTHTARIPILQQLFPRACYVYLVRNPFEVFASTVRLRQVMASVNGLSKTVPVGLEEEVLDDYLHLYQAYHMHRALIDQSQLCELRYEELVADPLQTIGRIYKQFELSGFEELRPLIEAQMASHRNYQTSTPPLPLADQERVFARWAPAFRRYGYAGPDHSTRKNRGERQNG